MGPISHQRYDSPALLSCSEIFFLEKNAAYVQFVFVNSFGTYKTRFF